MKISILTFSQGDNYGAVLQSYALGEWLRSKGHEVEYIYMTWSTWKYQILSSLTPLKYNFKEFRKRYLRDFSPRCYSTEDLSKSIAQTDLCIVGSDQVWNPDITTFRALHYFFDFVPDNVVKISYAASFGKKEWEWDSLTDKVKSLLKRFYRVSVREKEGEEICKDCFGISAKVVLDPTFLLNDYRNILTTPRFPNYVVGFMFHPSDNYYNLLGELGKIMNEKVVVMDLPSRKTKLSVFKFAYSPFSKVTSWVTNIANSSFVVTDSFHCLAFSIIFNKQFIFIASKKKLLSRVTTLLNKLQIKDRIVDSPEDAQAMIPKLIPIDYKKVNKLLNEERVKSEEFLFEVIGYAKKK